MPDNNDRLQGGTHDTKKPLTRLSVLISLGAGAVGAGMFAAIQQSEKGELVAKDALGMAACGVLCAACIAYALWGLL